MTLNRLELQTDQGPVVVICQQEGELTLQVVQHVTAAGMPDTIEQMQPQIVGWEVVATKPNQVLALGNAFVRPGHSKGPSVARNCRSIAKSTKSAADALKNAMRVLADDRARTEWAEHAAAAIETFTYDQMNDRKTVAELGALGTPWDQLGRASGSRVIIHGHGQFRGGVVVQERGSGIIVAWCTPNRPSSPIIKRYRTSEVYPNV